MKINLKYIASSLSFVLSLTAPQFVQATDLEKINFNELNDSQCRSLVVREAVKTDYEEGRDPFKLALVCRDWARQVTKLRGNMGLPYRLSLYGEDVRNLALDENRTFTVSLKTPIKAADGDVISCLRITTSPSEFIDVWCKDSFSVCICQGNYFSAMNDLRFGDLKRLRALPTLEESAEYIFLGHSGMSARTHFLYANISDLGQRNFNEYHGCITTFARGRCQEYVGDILEVLKSLPKDVLFYFLRATPKELQACEQAAAT